MQAATVSTKGMARYAIIDPALNSAFPSFSQYDNSTFVIPTEMAPRHAPITKPTIKPLVQTARFACRLMAAAKPVAAAINGDTIETQPA